MQEAEVVRRGTDTRATSLSLCVWGPWLAGRWISVVGGQHVATSATPAQPMTRAKRAAETFLQPLHLQPLHQYLVAAHLVNFSLEREICVTVLSHVGFKCPLPFSYKLALFTGDIASCACLSLRHLHVILLRHCPARKNVFSDIFAAAESQIASHFISTPCFDFSFVPPPFPISQGVPLLALLSRYSDSLPVYLAHAIPITGSLQGNDKSVSLRRQALHALHKVLIQFAKSA